MKLEGVLANTVSRLINKGLESKIGFMPGVVIDDFIMSSGDKDGRVSVKTTISMSEEDFNKLMGEVIK